MPAVSRVPPRFADRTGCEIVKVHKDHGISGAKGRDRRPAFDALCRAAARREFGMVMAWSVDRLGRSLQELVGFLSELHALKVDLFLHQQGLDTTTPAGKAMYPSSPRGGMVTTSSILAPHRGQGFGAGISTPPFGTTPGVLYCRACYYHERGRRRPVALCSQLFCQRADDCLA
jgi:hypothetical protein